MIRPSCSHAAKFPATHFNGPGPAVLVPSAERALGCEEASLKISVKRFTFFVEDLDAATKYYRDTLGLGAADVREGWSAFRASRDIEIAFHRGKGRRPRIELLVEGDLREARALLNERGARLGTCKEVRGREICIGKDSDGNSVELSAAD